MKKHLYYVLFACLTGLIMTACGSDGDDDFIPRKDGGSLKSGMLEVPALKGGSSILVTHVGTLNDRSGFRGCKLPRRMGYRESQSTLELLQILQDY